MNTITKSDTDKNLLFHLWRVINRDYSILYAILLVMLFFTFMTDTFANTDNFLIILRQASIIAIVAAGQYFVMIGGAFDLSVGSIVALCGVSFTMLMVNGSVHPFIAAIMAMFLGAFIGILNGLMVIKLNIPAFIATLGSMYAARGIVFLMTNAYPVTGLSEGVTSVGRGYFLEIPIPVYFMVAVYLIVYFASEKMKFGRYIFAMGGNNEASYLSGINTNFYKVATFSVCGALAALSGILLMARMASGQPNAATGYEFDSIIACVVGGVSLLGGKGKAFGVLFGALFVTMLTNGMTIMDVSSYTQQVLKGIVLVLAVTIDVFRNRPRR